ncbi:hypothetical protein [Methylobacterium tardum]|uniref:hypothetical protein n=1 Tax=Methylobacterium tardum TaxID=374432 RepID=UPI00361EBD72
MRGERQDKQQAQGRHRRGTEKLQGEAQADQGRQEPENLQAGDPLESRRAHRQGSVGDVEDGLARASAAEEGEQARVKGAEDHHRPAVADQAVGPAEAAPFAPRPEERQQQEHRHVDQIEAAPRLAGDGFEGVVVPGHDERDEKTFEGVEPRCIGRPVTVRAGRRTL